MGQLELVRTKEIIEKYLPQSPLKILDVGGATGIYSLWLAEKGYDVELIDPVPAHIEQAKAACRNQTFNPIQQFVVGDARHLDYADAIADAILLMGPLYHLVDKKDRLKALKESYRILKTGGLLFAAAISRFASCLDGFVCGYFQDPQFQKIMLQDINRGQHRNPTDNELYFTDAYFHHPDELMMEIKETGFRNIAIHGIEGIGYLMKDFNQNWHQKEYQKFLLEIIRRIDQDPSLLGASPHLMCIASKS